ncbi:MAG: gluconate 2-dehydrogenase subunit 3 family protein [Deltaproteobacteria bacterium]|nr:gluconate 2-dehydrogenase subunit 3 family protein [Deltaproteobacteria bacterium]
MGARIIRRTFLLRLGRATGAGLLLPGAVACSKKEAPAPPPARPAPPAAAPPAPAPAVVEAPPLPGWATGLAILSGQAHCAEAVLELLLPSDVPPGSPGARETRVLLHLDRVLATPAYASYARLLRDGFDRLDTEAKRDHGRSFAELPLAAREALLGDWQVRPPMPRAYPTGRFFQLVFTFALEGYLGDPKYGGNHQKLAWKWIDFSPGCPTPSGACGPGHSGHGAHGGHGE